MKNIHSKIALGFSILIMFAFTQNDEKQKIESALLGIATFYQSHENIYQDISYHLYADHSRTNIHSSENGVLILSEGKKYTQLGPIESFVNDKYNIGIDHDEKTIMLSNNYSEMEIDPLENISNYLKEYSTAEIQYYTKDENQLTFKVEYGEITKATILYKKDDFRISKIVLEYRREIQLEDQTDSDWVQPRLEIVYSNTSYDGKDIAKLQLNKYVTGSGNKWSAASEYADYKLIDNLQDYPFNN